MGKFNTDEIMVAGPFRSCTNLMKYMIDKYTLSKGLYNKWFWKHGFPPTMPSRKKIIPSRIPIVVMVIDPYIWHSSMYQFWLRRRPELLGNGETLQQFIRKNICIYDNTRINHNPQYLFDTPSDYWNKFYFSWLHWPAVSRQVVFVKSSDLLQRPSSLIAEIVSKFRLEFRHDDSVIHLPKTRKGPAVKPIEDSSVKKLDDLDVRFIKSRVNPDIEQKLEDVCLKLPS